MNDWNLQSRSRHCAACQRQFADKEPYHTLLFDEKGEFQREDLCDACWQQREQDGDSSRKGFVSYWQGIYEAPPPPRPDAIQKENAETLLRKLIERNDPAHGPACYILAAMLERKRLLKVKEQITRDNQRVFIYEQPRTGDIFTIADPDLQLNQLDAVQQDVSDLLEHGLNPPPDTAPPAEQAAPTQLSADAGESAGASSAEAESLPSDSPAPAAR